MSKNSRLIPYFLSTTLLVAVSIIAQNNVAMSRENILPVYSEAMDFKLPNFELDDLSHPNTKFSDKDIKGPALLNIWASWCQPCHREHALLLKISQHYHIPIYSILYKDSNDVALDFLKSNGNPYQKSGVDPTGNTINNSFNVMGTPMTFLINADGNVIYRYVGTLDENDWTNILLPLLKKSSDPVITLGNNGH